MNKQTDENAQQDVKPRRSIWDIKVTRSFSLGELLAGLTVLLVILGALFGYDYFTSNAHIWARQGKLIPILLGLGALLFGWLAIFWRGKVLLYGGVLILYVIACLTLYYYFDAIQHSLELKLGTLGAAVVLVCIGVGARHVDKHLL